jgi:hypothetical protein
MHFAKVGNGVAIWLKPLQQLLQLNVAAAFFFQLAAAADFI